MACLLKVVRTSSPSTPSGQGCAGRGINHFRVEEILEDVRPGLAGAFHGHAGADDLRQPVDVIRLDAAVFFNALAHGFGPRLGAKNAGAQRQILEVDAQFGRLVNEVQEITGRAADGGDIEILEDHDLALGVAAGNGNDRGAQRLRAVMRAQPAGEKAVAIGILNDVPAMQTAGRETAAHDVGPDINVLLGVGDDDGLAGGAGRGVQPDDIAHRRCEQPERIAVPKVGLVAERKAGDVVQGLDVAGFQAAFAQAVPEQGDVMERVRDHVLQARQLQFAQLAGGKEIRRADGIERRHFWDGMFAHGDWAALASNIANHSGGRIGLWLASVKACTV